MSIEQVVYNTRISCVICTYRRPDMLRMAIESLLAQTLGPEEYEIVVVDNNSQDETGNLVNRYIKAGSDRIRYMVEKQQGLSHARNTGVRVARGNVIAFLDDDAEADHDWLRALLRGYDSIPNAWGIGGKVLPIWDTERPEWLLDGLLPHLSLLDWGDRMRKLRPPHHLPGVNCSFRREVFEAVGYFPTDLGRIGESLLAGEEAELTRRIHRLGKAIYYLPQAAVYHHISKERLTKQYFRARLYWSGWSRAIYDRRTCGTGFAFRQVARSVWNLPMKLVQALRYLGQRDYKAKIFQQEVRLRWELGYVLGFARALSSGQ